MPSAISLGQNQISSATHAATTTTAAVSRGADADAQREQRGQEAQVRDEEGGQPEHERRLPPRHRQQEVAGGGEHQRADQPASFPGDRVGQRGGRQQDGRGGLDRGLQPELAGQLGPRGQPAAR